MSVKLLSEVELPEFDFEIDYDTWLFFIGSCFTNNVGSFFEQNFFKTIVNPFGVVYNPVSVAAVLNRILDKKYFKKDDLFEYNGLWHSFLHHSSFSGQNPQVVIDNINESIEKSFDFIQNTNVLFVTLGTSFVYELKESGEVVANCHKLPSSFFNRRRLEVKEITEVLEKTFKRIKESNPTVRIVLTVSPVRHLKDGAIGNNVSKANLILAVHNLVDRLDFVDYFPSYEIVMDELRDYRFYASDLVHLSDTAVEYILEKIKTTFLSPQTLDVLKIAEKLNKCLNHKVFNRQSVEYHRFIRKCKDYIFALEQRIKRKIPEAWAKL